MSMKIIWRILQASEQVSNDKRNDDKKNVKE